ERRPHPAEAIVGGRLLVHRVVRARHGVADPLARGDGGSERLEGSGARDLAGLVAAHPVGYGEEPELVVDEEGVLVVVPDPTDVGGGTDDEMEGHRTTSATVSPNW